MKFSVEVDIDWIDEESNIDETVSKEIIGKLVNKIHEQVKKDIDRSVPDKMNKKLDQLIMKTYEELLIKEITPRDSYGDAIGEDTTVINMLKDKLNKFMTEKVDSDGKPTNYNGELRYKQILNKEAQKQINSFINDVSTKVINGIKDDINAEAQERIARNILSDYDLKKLIK